MVNSYKFSALGKRYEPDDQEIISYAANSNEDMVITRGLVMLLSMFPKLPNSFVRSITKMGVVEKHKKDFDQMAMVSK